MRRGGDAKGKCNGVDGTGSRERRKWSGGVKRKKGNHGITGGKERERRGWNFAPNFKSPHLPITTPVAI